MRDDVKSSAGLASVEAARRLLAFGPNEIAREREKSPWALLAAQFNSAVIWLLVAACGISAALGELADAVAIGAIVLINGVVGFIQEYRAERAVAALRSMTAPRACVMRDGRAQIVPTAQVVPGDVIVLEGGDVVAADARLIEAHALSTSEAALTGESTPVRKRAERVRDGAPLAERHDCVFLGTSVATGTGLAEVTATGMRSELGHIAELIATAREEPTPLQTRLAALSRLLMLVCLGIVAVIAMLSWQRGSPPIEVLLSAVSLAVAAVPEGLPAIVTIALTIGMQRMSARRALVRRLMAVETLGCATVICTDKTGTLTTGTMVVREIWGADPKRVLEVAAACCNADLAADGRSGVGDPTEVAIVVAAAERGIRKEAIERDHLRASVHPFDPDRKMMSIYRSDGVLYAKGAVEAIAQRARSLPNGALNAASVMASGGLRVLAVAAGHRDEEADLVLIGLIGIADPPRPEAIDAIATAARAGIRTVMITGDHALTARAIARELGIVAADEPTEGHVHARASPEDKLRIVRDWKSRGAIVAMTGDGVNDAPALREAHIGIAMGRSGTEVTRQASDIVLADDNFATIVAAIEEGRGIFDNIRKAVVYLLAGNAGELAVVAVAAFVGLPPPLLPLHLLWINLVTDGLPALALVSDRRAESTMRRPPRDPTEPLVGRREWRDVAFAGALQAAATLSIFLWALDARSLEEARNLAFSVLVFGELLRAFSCRDLDRPFWEVGVLSNLRLLFIVLTSMLVQLAIHHVPATQTLFEIGPLSPFDCALSVAVGALPLVVLELRKVWRRRASSPDAERESALIERR